MADSIRFRFPELSVVREAYLRGFFSGDGLAAAQS
jgi:hypothetical protein